MELRLFVKYFWFFISMVFLQLLVFNNVIISDKFYPFILVLFILILPYDLENWIVVLVSFAVGLIYDSFNNSTAITTSALLFVGLLRSFVLKILSPNEGYNATLGLSSYNYGLRWFLLYATILTFVFQFFYNLFDYMTLKYFGQILLKSFVNSLLSVFFIAILHLLFYKNKA